MRTSSTASGRYSWSSPPLRKRRSDIPQLIDFKLALIHACGGELLTRPNKAGMQMLLSYSYRGNIRELFGILELAYTLNDGPELRIKPEYFPAIHPDDTVLNESSLFLSLDDLQAAHIRRVLRHCHGKISGPGGAAELLGINPDTLRSRMRKFGIRRGE